MEIRNLVKKNWGSELVRVQTCLPLVGIVSSS